MPPTQTEVDTYLSELRSKAQDATTTFGSDASEITKHRDGRVTVTLFFIAEANQDGEVTPGQINQSETAAVSAAEQLRTYGARTQIHSEGETTRVIGIFDAP